jgi:cytochrome c biogenesis protein CcmG, thiol:disulfide interchange protein DsbE
MNRSPTPESQEAREPATDGYTIPKPRIPLLLLAPLAAFLALAAFFAVSLQRGDPNRLPSALIGKPVPPFQLPPVELLKTGAADVPGFTQNELAKGKVTIVNVWASWCTPCIAEHPYLTELAKQSGAPLYGINYKDKPENARRFLGTHGNPFAAVGADSTGRTAIEWGVAGVPETFIVDPRGRIAYKHVGPITPEALARDLLPAIRKAGQ